MILLAVLSADGVNQDVIDNGGGQHVLQVIQAGVSEAEQLHILLSGPESDPDGKSQTEEAHNKGKCIELIHCLRFIGLNIAIISQ